MRGLENSDIRVEMLRLQVTQQEVADSWGISQASVSNRLRKPLPEKEKQAFLSAIQRIAKIRDMG